MLVVFGAKCDKKCTYRKLIGSFDIDELRRISIRKSEKCLLLIERKSKDLSGIKEKRKFYVRLSNFLYRCDSWSNV